MVLPGVSKTQELDFCVSPSILMAKPCLCLIYQPLPDTQCKPSAIFGFFDIKTSVSCMFLMNFSCGCLPPLCNGYCFKQGYKFMQSECIPYVFPSCLPFVNETGALMATLTCLTSSPYCLISSLSALYRCSAPYKAALQKYQEQTYPALWPDTGARVRWIWRNQGSTPTCC